MPPNFGQNNNADQFANYQGDPNGNMSYDESRSFAEQMLRANPGWQGNGTWKVENGQIKPRASWFERNQWIVPAGVGAGVGLAALLGTGAAAAAGAGSGAGASASAGAGAGGVLPSASLPVSSLMGGPANIASQGVSGIVAGAGGAGASATGIEKMLNQVMSTKGIKGLAGLMPLLMNLKGGGNNTPFGGSEATLMKEITDGLAMQRKRMEQAQPVYDTMVNMAYGATPTGYRGAPPANYTSPGEPKGAYVYQGPNFEGR